MWESEQATGKQGANQEQGLITCCERRGGKRLRVQETVLELAEMKFRNGVKQFRIEATEERGTQLPTKKTNAASGHKQNLSPWTHANPKAEEIIDGRESNHPISKSTVHERTAKANLKNNRTSSLQSRTKLDREESGCTICCRTWS
jgi:hypothetical protein